MGEVNRLTGTVRGGSALMLARTLAAGLYAARVRTVGRSICSCVRGGDISRRTSLILRYQYRSLRPARKRHYTQLVVQPLGWYRSADGGDGGDDVPQRGERLFVGLQNARPYHHNIQRLSPGEVLAVSRSSPDRLILYVIARWRFAYRAYSVYRIL